MAYVPGQIPCRIMRSVDPDGLEGHVPDEALEVTRLGARAATQLVLRAVAMRGITLVGMVLLARILTPTEFGTFAIVMFVVTLISVVGDFGVGASLIQQATTPTRLELATAWTLQQLLWGSIVGVLWLAAPALAMLAPGLGSDGTALIRVMSIALIFSGLRALPSVMMSRVLRFGPLAAIEVAQQVVYFACAIALAHRGAGAWSFVIAAVVQTATGALLTNLAWGQWAGMALDGRIARHQLSFGLHFQLDHILQWGREAVVPAFGGLAGGVGAVGLLQFAWRNGQLVSSIDEIAARLTFPAFSRLQGRPDRLPAMTIRWIGATALVIGFVQCWVAAVAPTLVPTLFSDTWREAVIPLQLVCVGTLATVPARFLGSALLARRLGARAVQLSLANLALTIVSFVLLAAAFGLTGAGLAFAGTAVITLLAYAVALRSIVEFPWRRVIRTYAETGACAVVAGLVVSMSPGIAGLMASGLAYVLAFGMLALAFEREPLRAALLLLRRQATGVR